MAGSPTPRSRSGAIAVAAGIGCSRVFGFIRESVFAHYFGNTPIADAFKAALRIPNFLQNLFGEGVLSASFIPVYARLRAHGEDEIARELAESVAILLAFLSIIISVLGVTFAPQLVDIITPGFEGEKRELTTLLTRIFFPGTACLVFSAWCLGILNSHRKFFLPYAAPVVWNGVIIASLLYFGQRGTEGAQLAAYAAYGVLLGSLLQFLIQLPSVLRILGKLRIRYIPSDALRQVLKNFLPVLLGRGVVQVSAFVDSMIASLIGTGAVAALTYAQTIYFLPVSLFGMSVSASELPEMSSAKGSDDERKGAIAARLERGLRQIGFFVIPSAAVFLALGDFIIGALFQSGQFRAHDTQIVWIALAAMGLGLPASAAGRLYSSTMYAMNDTRTPVKIALVRVICSSAIGLTLALYVPRYFELPPGSALAGLTLGTSIGAWIEFSLLRWVVRNRLSTKIGEMKPFIFFLAAAGVAITLARVIAVAIPGILLAKAAISLGIAGALYVVITSLCGMSEADLLLQRVFRKRAAGGSRK